MGNDFNLNQFVSGAIVMGYAVVALFFLRFWKQSGDRLFAFFAVAFWVLTFQRLALAFTSPVNEGSIYFYLVRLLAFLIIFFAILDKNRPRPMSD